MRAKTILGAAVLVLLPSAGACDGQSASSTLGGTGGQTTTTSGAGTGGDAGGLFGGGGGVATGGGGAGGAGGSGAVAGTGGVGAGGSGGALPTCDTGGPQDCSPGPGQGTADQCFDLQPQFGSQVNAAIDGVIANHPSWFDMNQCYPPANPYVWEPDLYVQRVAADLAQAGLCAIQDPNAGDEMPVKRNNNCAEQYDILTAQGCVRRPPGAYNGTCIPAWF